MTTLSQNKKKLREEKYGKKDDDKKDAEKSAGCLSRCIKEEDTETDIRVNVQGYSIKVGEMAKIGPLLKAYFLFRRRKVGILQRMLEQFWSHAQRFSCLDTLHKMNLMP